jgi:hypothetical protein
MSATSTGATPAPAAPVLSNGQGLEYKAFARYFDEDSKAAVLCLIATCYFGSSGYQIFFEEDAATGTFKLMQQNPTGTVFFIVQNHIATWPQTSTPARKEAPRHVTIVDANGEHNIEVHHWR